ncbi:GAF domain-containing protein [Nocardioides sp. cx-169]|uniref:sensor histidine kinase n=1 Tax=Nocardioides sp. cx-169 TaxID=2899080 RepID=UPI001E5D2FDB|nr:ATP-binding protein [Nocardioides sp. cx-169]MCD4533297.1 GAF domain-containing protein [Nocardioides sp. cx-169]
MRTATEQAEAQADELARLHLLLSSLADLSTDGALEDLLAQILDLAVDLVHAGHGALSITDTRGSTPPRLYTRGLTDQAAGAEDSHEAGAALLRQLIHGEASADPGDLVDPLPAGDHGSTLLPMRTFLKVPVHVRRKRFGTLHLTGSTRRPAFSAGDQEAVTTLAVAAGGFIETVLLREQAARRASWLESATAPQPIDDSAHQVVADRARELFGADIAWVVGGPDPDDLRLWAVSGVEGTTPEALAAVDFDRSLERCVTASGRALKANSLAEHPRAVDVGAALGTGPTGQGVVVPLPRSHDGTAAVALGWTGGREATEVCHDAALPTLLAEQAAVTLQVAEARQDQQRLAVLEDRDRIARDLHDLVLPRLFAVGLELQGTSWLQDPDAIAHRLDRSIADIADTIRDIRRTIFTLGPANDSSDPRAAVIEIVERAARTMKLRPTIQFRGPLGLLIDSDLLPDILAVLSEALSNAVRHGSASACTIEVSVRDGIRVQVTDNGTGMPDAIVESGLANARLRAERRGGHLHVTSEPGEGTSLLWSVPLT